MVPAQRTADFGWFAAPEPRDANPGAGDMSIFRKKPKADFSAVQSGSSSTAPAQGGAEAAASTAGAGQRTYTVVKGDTLSAIAQREYGAAGKWKAIYEANRDKISNPDLIQPGQVLTIPPAP
jgi:nucleoid-associated protein YgaU